MIKINVVVNTFHMKIMKGIGLGRRYFGPAYICSVNPKKRRERRRRWEVTPPTVDEAPPSFHDVTGANPPMTMMSWTCWTNSDHL